MKIRIVHVLITALVFALAATTCATNTVQQPKAAAPTIEVAVEITQLLNLLHSTLNTEWAMCVSKTHIVGDTVQVVAVQPAYMAVATEYFAQFACPDGIKGTWHNHVPEISREAPMGIGCYLSGPDRDVQDASDWIGISMVSCGPRDAPEVISRLHKNWRELLK